MVVVEGRTLYQLRTCSSPAGVGSVGRINILVAMSILQIVLTVVALFHGDDQVLTVQFLSWAMRGGEGEIFPVVLCHNKESSSFFCFAKRTKSIGGILSHYHNVIHGQTLTRKFRDLSFSGDIFLNSKRL